VARRGNELAVVRKRKKPKLPEPQLSAKEFAELIGVTYSTFRGYRVSKAGRPPLAPEPDGYVGNTPWWWKSTAVDWQADRPWACGNPREGQE
jgi:hypothetical protein